MVDSFRKEFLLLEEWARTVAVELGPDFDLMGKREDVLNNAILCTTFEVTTKIPANIVTETLVRTGLNYKKGRRYFFLFDKHKNFLFLLFYPYYMICNKTKT